jgi:hypothetical protein
MAQRLSTRHFVFFISYYVYQLVFYSSEVLRLLLNWNIFQLVNNKPHAEIASIKVQNKVAQQTYNLW